MEKEKKLKMLKDMIRVRTFELRVDKEFRAGAIPGFLHLYMGEEAVAVGACAVLSKDDYIMSTHRGHGHVLAKGADTSAMMAELYGKSTGCNKGKGGSMHIAVPEIGILGANGIVGGGIPVAAGAALSSKYLKTGRVTVCFFGDGASNEGTFHEALNIASKYNLPVIYVCENNLYNAGTPFKSISNTEYISERAPGYKIPAVIADGNDVMAVYTAVNEAAERARAGDGPTLVECMTYRWSTHAVGDPDLRPMDERESWLAKEPIERFFNVLKDQGIADESLLQQYRQEAEDEIDRAVRFASESPEPSVETALDDVFTIE